MLKQRKAELAEKLGLGKTEPLKSTFFKGDFGYSINITEVIAVLLLLLIGVFLLVYRRRKKREGACGMSNWTYTLYALILGIVAFFTGEIVTFIMLGFILMALININTTLKRIYEKNDGKEKAIERDI